MDSIRIDELPDGGLTDPKDKLALQRDVLGTWTDYHTDIETYFGRFRTVVFDIAHGDPSLYTVDPAVSSLLIFIGGHITYRPGGSPSSQSVQVSVAQSYNGSGWFASFVADAQQHGSLFLQNIDPTASGQWFENPNAGFEVYLNTTDFGDGGSIRLFLTFADVTPL